MRVRVSLPVEGSMPLLTPCGSVPPTLPPQARSTQKQRVKHTPQHTITHTHTHTARTSRQCLVPAVHALVPACWCALSPAVPSSRCGGGSRCGAELRRPSIGKLVGWCMALECMEGAASFSRAFGGVTSGGGSRCGAELRRTPIGLSVCRSGSQMPASE